jgi:hypothetical protein
MAAAVMGDAAVAFVGQEHHLRLPAVRIERPAVAEYHRLSYAPVLVINLSTVFRYNCAHVMVSLVVDVVIFMILLNLFVAFLDTT